MRLSELEQLTVYNTFIRIVHELKVRTVAFPSLAGDWVKFNFPISSATVVLAWGLAQWEDTYQDIGLHERVLDSIKWSLDYFLKCWKPDEQILYGQVRTAS